MPAPTFVAEYESVWNTSTTPKTTAAFNASLGDVLLSCLGDEGKASAAENYTVTNSGTAQTWTEVVPNGTDGADAFVQIAHAVMSVGQAGMTVTGTRTTGTTAHFWGHNVLHYTGSLGAGASADSITTQSVNITTTAADSSIVVVVADFNASDWGAATRPWLAVGGVAAVEQTYFRDSARYTVGVARWEGVGAAGSKTVGLTGLGAGSFIIAAREVLGTAGTATARPRNIRTSNPARTRASTW